MKKFFIISLVFLIITIFFVGIYNFSFKKEKIGAIKEDERNVIKEDKNVIPETIKKDIKNNELIPLSVDKTAGAVFDEKTGKILYFSLQDGYAWKMDIDGKNKEKISFVNFDNIISIAWTQNKTRAIIFHKKNEKNIFSQYDFEKGVAIELKNGLDNAIWDNLGLKMIYKYYDEKSGERTLNIADPDGNNWQKIINIDFKNIKIAQIPLTSIISFWNKQNYKEETILQTVGVTGGEVKKIFSERFGGDYLWSSSGLGAIVSSAASDDGKNISLGTLSLDGKYDDLEIKTIASKCAWSSDNKTIYCAVPKNLTENIKMPDDYIDGIFEAKDELWKIDTLTKNKQKIKNISEDAIFDAINIFLNEKEDVLFFINNADQKLYKVSLE